MLLDFYCTWNQTALPLQMKGFSGNITVTLSTVSYTWLWPQSEQVSKRKNKKIPFFISFPPSQYVNVLLWQSPTQPWPVGIYSITSKTLSTLAIRTIWLEGNEAILTVSTVTLRLSLLNRRWVVFHGFLPNIRPSLSLSVIPPSHSLLPPIALLFTCMLLSFPPFFLSSQYGPFLKKWDDGVIRMTVL